MTTPYKVEKSLQMGMKWTWCFWPEGRGGVGKSFPGLTASRGVGCSAPWTQMSREQSGAGSSCFAIWWSFRHPPPVQGPEGARWFHRFPTQTSSFGQYSSFPASLPIVYHSCVSQSYRCSQITSYTPLFWFSVLCDDVPAYIFLLFLLQRIHCNLITDFRNLSLNWHKERDMPWATFSEGHDINSHQVLSAGLDFIVCLPGILELFLSRLGSNLLEIFLI